MTCVYHIKNLRDYQSKSGQCTLLLILTQDARDGLVSITKFVSPTLDSQEIEEMLHDDIPQLIDGYCYLEVVFSDSLTSPSEQAISQRGHKSYRRRDHEQDYG